MNPCDWDTLNSYTIITLNSVMIFRNDFIILVTVTDSTFLIIPQKCFVFFILIKFLFCETRTFNMMPHLT